jgi:hypothetical protein
VKGTYLTGGLTERITRCIFAQTNQHLHVTVQQLVAVDSSDDEGDE